jgi:hypothetical protein
MKRIFTLCLLLFTALFLQAQDALLFWRIANPLYLDDTLQFDVEVRCSVDSVYPANVQVYFEYNTAAFGSNVIANNKCFIEKLTLMQGQFMGVEKYVINNITDNTPHTVAILLEAAFIIPNPQYMNMVVPGFNGVIRVKIAVSSSSSAGIYLPPCMMNGSFYGVLPNGNVFIGPYAVYQNNLVNYPLGALGTVISQVNNGVGADVVFAPPWYAGYYLMIPEGSYQAMATALCRTTDTVNVTVTAGQTTQLTFDLIENIPGKVEGAVMHIPEAPPFLYCADYLPDVELTIGSYTTHSNPTGYYCFGDVAPGTYTLTATLAGWCATTIENIIVESCKSTAQNVVMDPYQPPPGNLQLSCYDCNEVYLQWDPPSTSCEPLLGYELTINDSLLGLLQDPFWNGQLPYNTFKFCVSAVYGSGNSAALCDSIHIEPCIPPSDLQYNVLWPYPILKLTWNSPQYYSQWIHWDDGTNASAVGLTNGGTFYVASHWMPADLAPYDGQYISKIKFFHYTDPTALFVLHIWKGSNAGTLLLTDTVENPVVGDWNEIPLSIQVPINASSELWFGYTVTHSSGTFPAGTDAGPAIATRGDMISLNGTTWESLSLEYGLDYNWNLQAYVGYLDDNHPQGGLTLMEHGKSASPGKYNRQPDNQDGTNSLLGYHLIKCGNPPTWDTLFLTQTYYYDTLCDDEFGAYYKVTAQYLCGESLPSNTVDFICEGIGESTATAPVAYSDPATGMITIESLSEISKVVIYSMVGEPVYASYPSATTCHIQTTGMATGVYVVSVENREGVFRSKVIIQ